MPELPEVETIARGLKNTILDKTILDCEIKEPGMIENSDPETFKAVVVDKNIEKINRKGKYLIIQLSGENSIIFHLGMTGKLLVKSVSENIEKHTHVILNLNEDIDLRFNNVRKFGKVVLVKEESPESYDAINKLGPEPLEDNFTLEKFKNGFKNRTTFIKTLLMKQDFIAGIGNIYSDEALFAAGIKPNRRANTLSEKEIKNLYNAIKKTLKQGIKYCGTSISDYVDCKGVPGSFQEKLKVYGREGESCYNCGGEIVKEKISGRSSHYCPQCQK